MLFATDGERRLQTRGAAAAGRLDCSVNGFRELARICRTLQNPAGFLQRPRCSSYDGTSPGLLGGGRAAGAPLGVRQWRSLSTIKGLPRAIRPSLPFPCLALRERSLQSGPLRSSSMQIGSYWVRDRRRPRRRISWRTVVDLVRVVRRESRGVPTIPASATRVSTSLVKDGQVRDGGRARGGRHTHTDTHTRTRQSREGRKVAGKAGECVGAGSMKGAKWRRGERRAAREEGKRMATSFSPSRSLTLSFSLSPLLPIPPSLSLFLSLGNRD